MKPNPLPFLHERWRGVPKPDADFAGKAVIVTGSNTGIGFHAASTFAELGAELVILAVRNASKGATAQENIHARFPSSNVQVWELDMADYTSVESFAAKANELPHLDIVVLNAGIVPGDFTISNEGWESALQTNVLSTALLGLLLMPKLRAGRDTHLLIVTSEAHRWLEPSDFPGDASPLLAANEDREDWDPLLQNAKTKLFAMYVASGLSSIANGSVVVTPLCPGACKSDLMRHQLDKGFGQSIGLRIFDFLFNKPTEMGGWSCVWASTLNPSANGKWYKTDAVTE